MWLPGSLPLSPSMRPVPIFCKVNRISGCGVFVARLASSVSKHAPGAHLLRSESNQWMWLPGMLPLSPSIRPVPIFCEVNRINGCGCPVRFLCHQACARCPSSAK
eukprot:FR737564.1.p2 GENE.FR737564.1~~FR737564.1.p2  ORF type:complete len:105 (-),score=4.39 FR737564.1:189-503(-)